jgi:hypothetical protein
MEEWKSRKSRYIILIVRAHVREIWPEWLPHSCMPRLAYDEVGVSTCVVHAMVPHGPVRNDGAVRIHMQFADEAMYRGIHLCHAQDVPRIGHEATTV